MKCALWSRTGAVGEIIGWAYDAEGKLIDGLTNDRVASVPLEQPATRRVIGVAMGGRDSERSRARCVGKLINGLSPMRGWLSFCLNK